MKDLHQRACNSLAQLRNHELQTWQKVHYALAAYAKLQLTGLPAAVRRDLETSFLAVNDILARYPIKTSDDYQKIALPDLLQMCTLVEKLSLRILERETNARSPSSTEGPATAS